MTSGIHGVTVLLGDARERLKELPDASAHCCVTSPPYFGLRDYGVDGQMGLEATPAEYVAGMVAVFREVRRVLRDDGTLWLNLGDTYNNNPSTSNIPRAEQGNGSGAFQIPPEKHVQANRAKPNKAQPLIEQGIKKKDLIGIPWRVAFALQEDGWYLRQDIIWHKPNPMPESVRDRCTKAHEYLFLLSKGPRYHFDADVIAEPLSDNPVTRARNNRADKGVVGATALHGTGIGQSGNGGFERAAAKTRNKRSVWSVPTRPFPEAHFATFPPALIEPCILAGCPVGGTVLDPFGGSGTTAGVALKHARKAILCELNPDYLNLMAARIRSIAGEGVDLL